MRRGAEGLWNWEVILVESPYFASLTAVPEATTKSMFLPPPDSSL